MDEQGLHVYVRDVVPQGTIALGIGTDDDGRYVMFAGDHRPMHDIAMALAYSGEPYVEVDVPSWAILVHNEQA